MTSSIFTQLVLPLSLFVIMLGMGLSLQWRDFARVVKYPKAVSVGVVGQMILLPAFGFVVAAWLLDMPALAVGLVLLAACPGGTTSNLIAYHARGDLALSVTLTAISSVLTIVTIPLIVGLALSVFTTSSVPIELPVQQMMLTLFLITLLPISLGMLVRKFSVRWAQRLQPKISAFGAIFLALLIVIILIQQGDSLPGQISSAGPSTLILNVVMMTVGWLLAFWFQVNDSQRASITVEVGIQNSTLAILIATTVLHDGAMAVPAAMYSLVMYITGGGYIIWRRWNAKRAPASVH